MNKQTTNKAKQASNTNAAKEKAPVTPALTTFNLSKFADKLADKDVDKLKKDRELIYKYPDNIPPAKYNDAEGKKFRQGLRNKLTQFSNNIFVYAKKNEMENLKAEIERFDTFYAENFRVNDYSVKSITNTPKESKTADIALMLEIIREVKANA